MFVSDLLETEDGGGCNSFKASEQLVGQTKCLSVWGLSAVNKE